jgi:aminoglycoside phosphotransferase (APT) family kinase protein
VAIGLGEPIATGSRSRIYAWGQGAVVKVPDLDTPDEWIHAEARYAAAVASVGAPAPRFLGIEQIEGRPAAIYERVVGPSMWDHVVSHPEQSAQCGAMLARLQVELAELVPPVSLPRQGDRLSAKIRRATEALHTSADAALSLLPVASGPSRLCHGDLHPGNIILAKGGAVLVDWFDASCGDLLADVARTMQLLIPEHGCCPAHLVGADVSTLKALADAYAKRVGELVPIEPLTLKKWQVAEAVARLSEGASPRQRAALAWGAASLLEVRAV